MARVRELLCWESAKSYTAVLLICLAIQLWAIGTGCVHWNSDQAIVAIMARDILQRGAHPAFYYGSAYAGSLEPHLVACSFAVLGPSIGAYRVVTGGLLLLLVLCVCRAARNALGQGAALLAAMYLAIPPPYFLFKGLTSDGAYASLALLGSVCVLAALEVERAYRRGEEHTAWLAVLGVAAGLGWWVTPLFVYFYIAILIWFAMVSPRIFAGGASYSVFLTAFLAGSWPWWISNLRWDWKSLRAQELAPTDLAGMAGNLWTVWTEGIPVLFGSRPAMTRLETFPGETLLAVAMFAVCAGVCSAAVWRDARAPAARALLLHLLVVLGGILVASTNARTAFVEPRYLFPLFAVFPALFGFSTVRLWSRGAWGRVLACALLAAALGMNAGGLFVRQAFSIERDAANDGALPWLVAELERRGVRSVYASYWVAYRLAFDSGDRIAATPFGDWRLTRVLRYRELADRDPNPAFVLADEEADRLRRHLLGRKSRFREIALDRFRLFVDLDEESLRELRAASTIPDAG